MPKLPMRWLVKITQNPPDTDLGVISMLLTWGNHSPRYMTMFHATTQGSVQTLDGCRADRSYSRPPDPQYIEGNQESPARLNDIFGKMRDLAAEGGTLCDRGCRMCIRINDNF